MTSTCESIADGKPQSDEKSLPSSGDITLVEDEQPKEPPPLFRRRAAFSLFLFLLVAFPLAVILDLVLAPTPTPTVDFLSLDVSPYVPKVTAELSFDFGSRLSRLEPRSVHCAMPSGSIDIQVVSTNELHNKSSSSNSSHLLYVSCPTEDVADHATMLWAFLTTSNTTLGKVTCAIRVDVHFAHLVNIPYTHKITIDSDDGPKTKVKAADKTNDNENNGLPFPITLRSLSAHALEVGLRLELPPRFLESVHVVQLTLPSLTVNAQPADQPSGLTLAVEELDKIILQESYGDQDDSSDDSNQVVFRLTCNHMDCSWYGPIFDMLLGSGTNEGSTTIDLTVDGGNSFSEVFLGQQHSLALQFYERNIFDGQRHLGVADRMKRIVTQQSDFAAPIPAHCMSMDDGGNFDFAMCWVLTLSEGFTFMSNVKIYDFIGSASWSTVWRSTPTSLQLDSKSLVEVGDDGELMSMVGAIVLDWEASVQMDMSLVNDGTWSPFNAKMLWDGDLVNDILTVNMKELSWFLESDVLANAIGSVRLDLAAMTLYASVTDPKMQFEIEGQFSEDDVLTGHSTMSLDGDSLWNANLEFQVFDNDDGAGLVLELRDPGMHFNVKAWIDGGTALSGNSTLRFRGNDYWDSQVDARLLTNYDDSFAGMHMFLIDPMLGFNFDCELAEDYFTGKANLMFGGKAKWGPEAIVRWVVPGDSTMNSTVELYDSTLDYSMSAAASGRDIDDVLTFSLDRLVFILKQQVKADMTGRFTLVSDEALDMMPPDSSPPDTLIGSSFPPETTSPSSFHSYQDQSNTNMFPPEIMPPPPLQSYYSTEPPGNWTWQFSMEFSDFIMDYTFSGETDVQSDKNDLSMAFQVKDLLFQMEQQVYVSMQSEFVLNSDDSMVQFHLQDDGKLNYVLNISPRWFSNGYDIFDLALDEAKLSIGSESYVDLRVAKIEHEEYTSTKIQMVSSALATIQLGTDVLYEYVLEYDENYFTKFNHDTLTIDQLRFGTQGAQGELLADMNGHVQVDYEGKSFLLYFEDSTTLDFIVDFLCRSNSENSSLTFDLDKALTRVGPDVFIDSSGTFTMEDVDSKYFGAVDIVSSNEADLGIEMGSNFTWIDKTLTMVCDHVRMRWKNTTYIGSSDNVEVSTPTPIPDSDETEDSLPKPQYEIKAHVFVDLRIELIAVDRLTPTELEGFIQITVDWFETFFAEKERRRVLTESEEVYAVSTSIKVKSQVISETKTTNGKSVPVNTLWYDQTLVFKASPDATTHPEEYLVMPYQSDADRSAYEVALIDSNPAFSNLQTPIEPPAADSTVVNPFPDLAARDAAPDDGLSAGAAAGITSAVMLVVFAAGIAIVMVIHRRRKNRLAGEKVEQAEDAAVPEFAPVRFSHNPVLLPPPRTYEVA